MQKSAKEVTKVGAWFGFVELKPELDRCLKTTAFYVCFVLRADRGRDDRARADIRLTGVGMTELGLTYG